MILAIINMKAGNYFLQRAFLAPLQELSSTFAPALVTEDGSEHGVNDHKPPKSSFAKHEGLSNLAGLLPIVPPSSSHIYFSEPFSAHPEVFAEIDIPPKIALRA